MITPKKFSDTPTAEDFQEAADHLDCVGDIPGEPESSASCRLVARWLREIASRWAIQPP